MSIRFVYLRRRRAATAVLVVITLPILLGFAALAVDVGRMFNVRAELQIAADAAAMAAAIELASDPDYGDDLFVPDEEAIRLVGQQFAEPNHGVTGTLADADVVLGNWDGELAEFTAGGEPINAVGVITRRSETNGNPVELFFAKIFGLHQTDISAAAVPILSSVRAV